MSPRRLGQGAPKLRAALLGAAIATATLAAAATPAAAWTERYTWDDVPAYSSPSSASNNAYSDRGMILDAGCGGYRIGGFGPMPFGPRSAPQAVIAGDLNACSQPQFYLGWNNAPRTVQLWVRSPTTPRTIIATDYTNVMSPVPATYTLDANTWTRIQLVKPAGGATTALELKSMTGGAFLVDDVVVSDQPPGPPPATVIDEAPPPTTESTTARVAFHNDLAEPVFTCELDGVGANACTSPWTTSGLGVGEHTLRIWATSLFGIMETPPRVVKWNVTAPPPPPPPPAPPTPTCPPGPDSDGDGIPDVCDTVGQPGTVPPASGVSTNVKVESGEVFIKLPPTVSRARAGIPATRQQAGAVPGSGYVPLKGNATVPVGSTVDARAGSITVTSATGASAKGGAAPPTASAKLSAAIFQIRQDRVKRATGKSKKKLPPNPTALVLRSPEGAIAAAQCRASGSAVIRSLSAVVPKGSFAFVGAAATVTTSTTTANVRTVDRCDGTYAEVGRGLATLTSLHRKRKKVVRVKAGRAYLMKGDFLSIEGRKGR